MVWDVVFFLILKVSHHCSAPAGLKILSVYMSGSKNMSYDSASLTTPDIKWLGVRPSDLDKYQVRFINCFIGLRSLLDHTCLLSYCRFRSNVGCP
jgi:DNA topoisomerase VI subunit A